VRGKRKPISKISKCGTEPQWAAMRISCPSSSKMVTSSASQKRAALLTTASSTGRSSVGEVLMILRTSAVAVCCSRASSSSRRSRATSVSWATSEESGERTTFDALPRFDVTVLRLRALVGLLLALERRRIAHPRLRTTPISKVDYSRDLRPAKWGSMIDLHCKNPERSLPVLVLAVL
jgi:hypothetical protein